MLDQHLLVGRFPLRGAGVNAKRSDLLSVLIANAGGRGVGSCTLAIEIGENGAQARSGRSAQRELYAEAATVNGDDLVTSVIASDSDHTQLCSGAIAECDGVTRYGERIR